ncbi:MAG: nucleoside triphosphate pyrophosphohydrolase [Anaerolineae bacterium]|nr:nucleoside triphosphate pyrophosphohydrolase [Anaerolineae bacterium]
MDVYRLALSALAQLALSPDALQVYRTSALTARHYPDLNPDRPAVIAPIEHVSELARLAACLGQVYPEQHQVTLVTAEDGAEGQCVRTPLGRLPALAAPAVAAALYVPPLPCAGGVQTFQETVAHLRAPDGCPWDREQTHRSLRQGFQEETHEVLDALDRGDLDALKEELGDVLLHVLLQAQIAAEMGEFRMSDVVCAVNTKIVYRHPHVFGDLEVDNVDQVLVNWELLKGQEKASRAERSALDGIPPTMPALARAQSLQRHVLSSYALEVDAGKAVHQVARAMQSLTDLDPDRRAATVGQLLFDLANLARLLGVDAESALREASASFEARVRALEQ